MIVSPPPTISTWKSVGIVATKSDRGWRSLCYRPASYLPRADAHVLSTRQKSHVPLASVLGAESLQEASKSGPLTSSPSGYRHARQRCLEVIGRRAWARGGWELAKQRIVVASTRETCLVRNPILRHATATLSTSSRPPSSRHRRSRFTTPCGGREGGLSARPNRSCHYR